MLPIPQEPSVWVVTISLKWSTQISFSRSPHSVLVWRARMIRPRDRLRSKFSMRIMSSHVRERTMASAEIELRGHIIDSLTLPRVWGAIEDAGAHFQVREMTIGGSENETSYARIEVTAATEERLDELLSELRQLGATAVEERDAATERVVRAGILPDAFYSTTNLPTWVRADGRWLPVDDIEMDVAIVVDRAAGTARGCPMHAVQEGDEVV